MLKKTCRISKQVHPQYSDVIDQHKNCQDCSFCSFSQNNAHWWYSRHRAHCTGEMNGCWQTDRKLGSTHLLSNPLWSVFRRRWSRIQNTEQRIQNTAKKLKKWNLSRTERLYTHTCSQPYYVPKNAEQNTDYSRHLLAKVLKNFYLLGVQIRMIKLFMR